MNQMLRDAHPTCTYHFLKDLSKLCVDIPWSHTLFQLTKEHLVKGNNDLDGAAQLSNICEKIGIFGQHAIAIRHQGFQKGLDPIRHDH